MLILEKDFEKRLQICFLSVFLLMILTHTAPQHPNNSMKLKQLSTNITNVMNTSVQGINPFISSSMMIANSYNHSYTGKPKDVSLSLTHSNIQTNMKIGSNFTTQPHIKDSYNKPVIMKPLVRFDTELRSPIVNQSPKKSYASYVDDLIKSCQKNAVAGTFCVFTDDYLTLYKPISHSYKDSHTSAVDENLKKYVNVKGYHSYFGNDTIAPNLLETKIHFDQPEFRPLCASEVSIKQISVAQNVNGEFKAIAQSTELFQRIRVEICQPDIKCEAVTFPNGYQSQCVQKYMFRKLVSYSGSSELDMVPVLDDFRIPSCCACEYKSVELFRKKIK